MRKQLLFAGLLLIVSSCALKPQNVELKPVAIKPANLHLTEKKVTVQTKDSRPMPQVLGIRHKQELKMKIPFLKPQEIPYINNHQNLAEEVTKIANGYLVGEGFEIAQDGVNLEITLAVFQYETLEKKWYQMPKTKIQLFFTSQVKNKEGAVVYNGRHEYLVENTYPIFQPRSKKNEEVLSDALSQGIKQIFTDSSLIESMKSI